MITKEEVFRRFSNSYVLCTSDQIEELGKLFSSVGINDGGCNKCYDAKLYPNYKSFIIEYNYFFMGEASYIEKSYPKILYEEIINFFKGDYLSPYEKLCSAIKNIGE